jgi:glycine dehydrogenase subunit 1
MMKTIGAKSVDDFYTDVPASARLKGPVPGLPNFQGELEVERHMTKLSKKNRAASDGPFFVGCGAYKHHIPASVDHIIQRSEFLTTYTPYQPEIAQGTLQDVRIPDTGRPLPAWKSPTPRCTMARPPAPKPP